MVIYKTYLVTYQAYYWDVNKPAKIRQEKIEIGVNEDMTNGKIAKALQENIEGGDIKTAFVINFWEM